MANIDDLEVTALNALASAPGGMTLPDLSAFIESRQGSTDEGAQDARSAQSRQLQGMITNLVSGPGSLADRGYVVNDGGIIRITDAGRAFVGR